MAHDTEHLVAELERVTNLLRRRDQVTRQIASLRYELEGLDDALEDRHVDELGGMFPKPSPAAAEGDPLEPDGD